MLEKTLESPLDSKKIKPVNPKGNQPWIFTGRAYGEAPILWPPDVMRQLTGKFPELKKDWAQEEKGVTENEIVDKNLSKIQETVEDREAWRVAVHGVTKSRTQLKRLDKYQFNLGHCIFISLSPRPSFLRSALVLKTSSGLQCLPGKMRTKKKVKPSCL